MTTPVNQPKPPATNRQHLAQVEGRRFEATDGFKGHVEGRRAGAAASPRMAGDSLQLGGGAPARADGRPRLSHFDRMDADRNGAITRAEHDAWATQRVARTAQRLGLPAPAAPTTAPAAPPAAEAPPAKPVFGYQTRHPHGVDQLAAQFGITPEALMEANGWTEPRNVPGGSRINLPDEPAVRGLAEGYGGAIGDPVVPGEAPAKGEPAGLNAGGIGIAGDPTDVHMTQFVHERFNNSPDAPWGSANCGPTSLAMGLKAVGLDPAGMAPGADTEGRIDATRQAMGAMTDAYGHYGDSAYTDISQVIAGAEASGATTAPVTFETIDAALAQGLPVVAAGNPAVYNGDWQERGISNSEYDGGHFVTVTGRAANGNYVINDPLSNVGAVEVTPGQLQAYMAVFGAGSAVSIANPYA